MIKSNGKKRAKKGLYKNDVTLYRYPSHQYISLYSTHSIIVDKEEEDEKH